MKDPLESTLAEVHRCRTEIKRLEKIRQRADLRHPNWSDTLYCFTVIDELKEALITIADRLEDEGCQCDASDEYVYRCNLCVANDALKSNRSTLNTDKV